MGVGQLVAPERLLTRFLEEHDQDKERHQTTIQPRTDISFIDSVWG